MDKKFRLIARPPHIINEQNQYLLFFIMMKFSPYCTFFFSKYTKISANTISFFSIIFLLLSFVCLFLFNYLLAFIFLFLNLFLDNIDGELSRVNNQTSKFGEFLEKINSDIFYIFFYNLISLNFYRENKLDLFFLTFFFLISLIHFFIRNKISHINFIDESKINFLNSIYLGLFKYSNNIRNKYFTSKILYLFFWNIISSGGVSEIIFGFLLIFEYEELSLKYLYFYFIILFVYITFLTLIKIIQKNLKMKRTKNFLK